MKKILIALLAMAVGTSAFADPTTPDGTTSGTNKVPVEKMVDTNKDGTVSILSKGKDVRDVLTDLFTQAKKNFVVDKLSRIDLYLSLNNIEFDETLQIICKLANLDFEIQNGIYYITKFDPNKKQIKDPEPGKTGMGTPTQPKYVGKLSPVVLDKKVTVRYNKTDFREVIKGIARQADIWIEVDANLPERKVDAYLIETSVKQSLDMLTSALGLEYKFTENMSIMIYKPQKNEVKIADN
ncbi:MAG: hypothetical protein JST40_00725 [Armatimonadetes bacterium]|nr:hypothetical protein [Armatimonadota bacterium]